jgi:hypothetical protein
MRAISFRLPTLALAAAFLWSGPAAAWERDGHRIVALIAAPYLTPAAKTQVQELLGGDPVATMMSAASWADEIADSRPETRGWHYAAVPVDQPAYDPARDCPDGNCVVAQTERAYLTLADKTQPKAARAEALKFLIHLIGDIHQPLNCGDNGTNRGNDIKVTVEGKDSTLYALWETAIVPVMGSDPTALATRFRKNITPQLRKSWFTGSVRDWCWESAQVAKTGAYDDLRGAATENGRIIISGDYPYEKANIASTQMKKAGVRLSGLINQALK